MIILKVTVIRIKKREKKTKKKWNKKYVESLMSM